MTIIAIIKYFLREKAVVDWSIFGEKEANVSQQICSFVYRRKRCQEF
jgi:hypothetical protein